MASMPSAYDSGTHIPHVAPSAVTISISHRDDCPVGELYKLMPADKGFNALLPVLHTGPQSTPQSTS